MDIKDKQNKNKEFMNIHFVHEQVQRKTQKIF